MLFSESKTVVCSGANENRSIWTQTELEIKSRHTILCRCCSVFQQHLHLTCETNRAATAAVSRGNGSRSRHSVLGHPTASSTTSRLKWECWWEIKWLPTSTCRISECGSGHGVDVALCCVNASLCYYFAMLCCVSAELCWYCVVLCWCSVVLCYRCIVLCGCCIIVLCYCCIVLC